VLCELLRIIVFCSFLFWSSTLYAQSNILFQYDLEDLSQISMTDNSATLTPTDPKSLPASIVTITQKEIQESGARSLDELLEIYVPSFSYMYKVEGTQIGMRGIISDRNNKILLLVNGQKMNILASDGGAVTERWFSLLGDIRRITVINGPGSAVYGAGAIAGVINIETFEGSEKEGVDATVKRGMGDQFEALELRYSHMLENGWSFLSYGGVENDEGASLSDASHKLSFSVKNEVITDGSADIKAYENFPYKTVNDHASYDDTLRYKLHLQLTGDNFTLWSRYTRSGLAIATNQGFYRSSNPDILQNTGTMNQQWTTTGEYLYALSSQLSIKGTLSYRVSDILINLSDGDAINKNWREKTVDTKIVANYTSEDERDSIAFGVAYEYSHFGERSALGGESISHIGGGLEDGVQWDSFMVSLFEEYQKHLGNHWVLFSGLRIDKHRFSDWMYSPRLSAIYTPDASKVFKFIYNRSVRHSDDANLYKYYLQTGENGDVETIDNLEVIADYFPSRYWNIHLSLYYNKHHVVAYNDATKETEKIGKVDFYGIEGIVNYRYNKWRVSLSHNYTKLRSFTLENDETIRQNISALPKGYGDDFANWYNHMTKIVMHCNESNQFSWNVSLRYFWEMPGAIDMAHYNMETFEGNMGALLRLPLYEESTRVFEESLYVDLGLTYQYSDAVRVSLYGYDLAGLFNSSLNKRNYFQRTSHFRESSPALSVQLSYQFE